MPFKNREQYLTYHRNYRRLQRAQQRLSKLKEKFARLQEACKEDAATAYVCQDYSYDLQCDIKEYEEKVEQLKGLLHNYSNLQGVGGGWGVTLKP